MRRILFLLLVLSTIVYPLAARAQAYLVVASCGSLPQPSPIGSASGPIAIDRNGNLCSGVTVSVPPLVIPTPLAVNMPLVGSVVSGAYVDGSIFSIGSVADAIYNGSGSATVISALKGIYAAIKSLTVTTNIPTPLAVTVVNTPLSVTVTPGISVSIPTPLAVTVTNTPIAVTQSTSPWVVTGNALVTEGTTPWQVAFTNQAVNQGTNPWIVTGNALVTQSTTPWQVAFSSVPAHIVNQGTTPWIVSGTVLQGTSPWTVTGNALVTQSTSPWQVSFNQPTVNQGTSPWIVSGTVLQGTSPWVVTSSPVTIPTPLAVTVVNTPIDVKQNTSPWIVSGTVLQGTSPWVVTGNALVTQSTSPWQVNFNQPTVNQGTSPWVVTGNALVTQSTTPWQVNFNSPTVLQGSPPWAVTVTPAIQVTANVPTPLAVTVTNTPIAVTQSTSPWVVTGNALVTQSTSPWQVNFNQPTVNQGTSPWVVTGNALVTQSTSPWQVNFNQPTVNQGTNPWVVTGNALVTQSTSPWQVNFNQPTVNQGTNPWIVSGNTLNAWGRGLTGGPIPNNGSLIAGIASSTEEPAASPNTLQAFWLDLVGKIITSPYANRENYVSGSVSTSGVTVAALIATPAIASYKYYITDFNCTRNDAGTTAIVVSTNDVDTAGVQGAKGWTVPNSGGGGGFMKTFNVPLKTAAGTAFQIKNLTGSGVNSLICTATGYVGY